MNQKSLLGILQSLIFLIVFNIVFFVVGGFSNSNSAWISYLFIHVAYFLLLTTPFFIRKSKSSSVFGFSLFTISGAYFVTEFVLGTIFIVFKVVNPTAAFVVQFILLGVYATLLIPNLIANEHTADKIVRQEYEVYFIKNVSSKVSVLVNRVDDKKLSKEIEAIADLLHSSPTKTNSNVAHLEAEIRNYIFLLENAIFSNDENEIISLCNNLKNTISERNRQIQLNQ